MSPGIGQSGLSSVQEDWLGCLAVDLRLIGLGQELAHRPPEEASLGVPLLEIECSRTCKDAYKSARGTGTRMDRVSWFWNQKQIPGKIMAEPACWRKAEKAVWLSA